MLKGDSLSQKMLSNNGKSFLDDFQRFVESDKFPLYFW